MADGAAHPASMICLLCRVERRLCALPIGMVHEIMRPLPVEPMAWTPHFVLGASVIRGDPVPVIDGGRLFGEDAAEPRRLVLIRVGERRVALLVDDVVDVRAIDAASLSALPGLLSDASGDRVAMLGSLDGEFLFVLQAARLLESEQGDDCCGAGAAS
jgi:purine-binding chemotaxis protein CheW